MVVVLLILGQGGKVCLGLALCLFCRRPKSEQNTEGDSKLQIFIVILTLLYKPFWNPSRRRGLLFTSPQFATSVILVDDDDSELVTSGKFLKMGTLGPTLLIKSKSADTRRWCTHSQVETTNSSQQTYGRVYYRYSEAFEFKDGLLHCIDAVLRFTLSIKFRL